MFAPLSFRLFFIFLTVLCPVLPLLPATSRPATPASSRYHLHTQIASSMESPMLMQFINTHPEYQPMLETMKDRAQQYTATHYELYHSHTYPFKFLVDIITTLQSYLTATNYKNFFFFRFPHHRYSHCSTVHDFFSKMVQEGSIFFRWNYPFDKLNAMRDLLLSVNFSPLDHASRAPGESSLAYYQLNWNQLLDLHPLIKQYQAIFNLTQPLVDEIIEHIQSVQAPSSHLYQIFIPHQIIDKVVYISRPFGVPALSQPLENLLGNNPLLKDTHKNLRIVMQKAYRGDALEPANFLDRYQTNIQSLVYRLDDEMLQARILISNDYFLNPQSGIKIFCHNSFSKEQQQNHNDKVGSVSLRILKNMFKRVKNSDSFSYEEGLRMAHMLSQLGFVDESIEDLSFKQVKKALATKLGSLN